jgi:2-iminobutanoate/2-iminopropanoate deaminase
VACSGDLVFLSGQIALCDDGTLDSGDVSAQTHRVFLNIRTILSARGLSLTNVVKCTVFLADMVSTVLPAPHSRLRDYQRMLWWK